MVDVKHEPRPRGRPRKPDTDQLIVAATLRLLAEHGYDRCSIDAVADEAGVTRATVYRRYPTKADLVTQSVCAMQGVPDPAQMADPRACLIWLLGQFREGIGQADGVSIVASLYVQRHEHPDMLARFRDQVIRPGREKFLAALEAGVQRGSVRPDADLELAVDQLIGAYLTRTFTGAGFGRGWAERLVDQVWPGICASTADPA
jgi:AcrR family transcriptional regulator